MAGARSPALSRLVLPLVCAALLLATLSTYSERWDLAAMAGSGGSARVGDAAPPFGAPALDGSRVALDDLRGRVVVLNFWATWCGPCAAEMPDLQAYADEQGGRVVILGVNMQESPDAVAAYVRRHGLTFPILLDASGSVARAYHVTALPSSVILDRSGAIRDRVVGPMTRDVLARRVARLQ